MLKVCHYNKKLTNCNLSCADVLNFFQNFALVRMFEMANLNFQATLN